MELNRTVGLPDLPLFVFAGTENGGGAEEGGLGWDGMGRVREGGRKGEGEREGKNNQILIRMYRSSDTSQNDGIGDLL